MGVRFIGSFRDKLEAKSSAHSEYDKAAVLS
jgi:hypothetical protein